MACLTDQEKESIRAAGYKFSEATQWLAYNLSTPPSATPSADHSGNSSMISAKCVYQLTITAGYSLGSFLAATFAGELAFGPGSLGGSSLMQQFFQGGNITFATITSTMSNISDAMTTYIRQNGEPDYSAPALGVIFHNEACVRVRWA